MTKPKKSGLGTDVKNIIPSTELINTNTKDNINTGEPLFIKISDIEKNPYQPRKIFNKEELYKLSESIKQIGILEPLIVINKENKYILIAGHRRLMAAKEAKLEKVPVIIREKLSEPSDYLELALIENIIRQDLNPIEEAESYDRLVKEFSKPTLSIAKLVGKDRSTIDNAIRLLKLPEEVKTEISHGRISAGHGKALLSLSSNTELIINTKNEILSKSLSVRQTELLIKKLLKDKKIEKNKTYEEKDAYFKSIGRALSEHFGGLKVILRHSGKNKKIEISYIKNEDIELILNKLNIIL
jgi:ParB family chromosome partitioning protein